MPESGYNQFCPVAMAAEILALDGPFFLVRELLASSTRFNDLRRGVPRMSPALLSKRLKGLEGSRDRHTLPGVRGAGFFEYQLTDAGRDLQKVIEAVGIWGQGGWKPKRHSEKLGSSAADVGHSPQDRSKTDASPSDHNPDHLQRSRKIASKLVAYCAARPGSRPMFC